MAAKPIHAHSVGSGSAGRLGPDCPIGVVVVTHQSKRHLRHCLPPILNSPVRPRVLVVNSSSHDGTVEAAQRLGAETLVIPRRQFNHGSTRERARKHVGTDIVVMMTPDAYPADDGMLGRLVEPLVAGAASVAYARQIPRRGAGTLEAFSREFNYPADGHVRSLADVAEHGVYSVFCSDACAAYLNSALDEIGGFVSTLTHEDAFAVAALLARGHKVAYVAEAVVEHSHSYSLWAEFRRYFDTGYARTEYGHLTRIAGRDESRGKAYAVALIKRLARSRPWLLPYGMANLFARWLGYRIGAFSLNAPLAVKKALTSQEYYWSSEDYLRKQAHRRGRRPRG